MPDPSFTLVAAARADQTTDMLRQVAATSEDHVAGIETVARDISQFPRLQHFSEVKLCRPPAAQWPVFRYFDSTLDCCSRCAAEGISRRV